MVEPSNPDFDWALINLQPWDISIKYVIEWLCTGSAVLIHIQYILIPLVIALSLEMRLIKACLNSFNFNPRLAFSISYSPFFFKL